MVFDVWAGRYLGHGAQKPHRYWVGCFLGEPTVQASDCGPHEVVLPRDNTAACQHPGSRNILMVGVGKTRNLMKVQTVITAKLDDLLVGFAS